MTIAMPQLPYSPNALEPVISEQTINYHYGKHLQAYVNTLGTLVQGTEFEGKSVDEIVMTAPDGPIFNNAGQTLNHALYFGQFKSPVKDNVPNRQACFLKFIETTKSSIDFICKFACWYVVFYR